MTDIAHDPNLQASPATMPEKKSNGVGVAGFILAIISLLVGWIPVLGWIIWLVGAILSIVGVFKKPKGFAIAGLIISFIGLITLITVFGAALKTASAFM
ncbi:MAG: hypothetical protein ACEPOW_00185 [Bacteroidales bacterium]